MFFFKLKPFYNWWDRKNSLSTEVFEKLGRLKGNEKVAAHFEDHPRTDVSR